MSRPAPPHLTDRVAIVTGAAAGMGAATARLFAQAGAKTILSDIDAAAGEAVAAEIVAAGGKAIFVRADVSVEADVAALVAAGQERWGRLDCAVNNAAARPDGRSIVDLDMAEFDRLIAINLRSVALCMKHQMIAMKAGGGGAIVNISSVSGERARPNNAAYVAAKHGVIGLTKVGAVEGAASGIRVNAVLPGTIDTPMIRRTVEATGRTMDDVAAGFSALARFGDADEVAQANVWLCSDAASYITGQSLAVDGGYLALAR